MKRQENIRRSIAGFLLTVIVSMNLLCALHVHRYETVNINQCEACVGHLPHASHYSKAVLEEHKCLICKVSHLTFIIPVMVKAPLMDHVTVITWNAITWNADESPRNQSRPRAPPMA